MKSENIKKTISAAYLLALIGRGCDVLYFFVLFKYLSVDNIGFYSWVMAVAAFWGLFLDLGLDQTLVRGFSNGQINLKNALFGSTIIRSPIIVAGLIMYCLWNLLLAPLPGYSVAIIFMAIMQVIMLCERFCQCWLKANGKQTVANVTVALDPILRMIVGLTLLYYYHIQSVASIFIALCLMHGIILLVVATLTWREYHNKSTTDVFETFTLKQSINKLVPATLIFGAVGLVTTMQNRLDWLLVSRFASKVELANYSLSNKIYEIFLMMIGITLTTLYPWMCNQKSSQEFQSKLNIATMFIAASGVTISLLCSLYLPDVLQLVWGNKYESSKVMIQSLMVMASISTIICICYYQLIAKGLEKKILHFSVISTGLQLLTNLVAIPRFGGFGAVMGMAVLAIVNIVAFTYLMFKEQIMELAYFKRTLIFLAYMLISTGSLYILQITSMFGVVLLLFNATVATLFVLMIRTDRNYLLSIIYNAFANKNTA